MDNRYPIDPYRDPTFDDHPTPEQILNFGNEGPSLGFNQFPQVPEPSSSNINTSTNNNTKDDNAVLFPQPGVGVGIGIDGGGGDGIGGGDGGAPFDPNDPFSDSYLWDMLNDCSGNEEGNFVAGSSGDFSGRGNCDIPQSADFGNPIQLPIWPVPPSPYNCSGCHILREIIHTNGVHITNLEIHGRLGIITHAILDKYDFDFSTQNHEYQMFDFCKESIISVKNFLQQYYEFRKWEGCSVVPDPLSIFYKALCVGIDETENQNFPTTAMASGNDTMPGQENIASEQNLRQQEGESSTGGREQRERTGKMKLKDFSGYFHLTINDAAKQMRVCPTVIKKKCREAGLSRWPYRKIKGIKRKISTKEQSLATATAEEKARTLAEIQMLKQELANIFQRLTSHESSSRQ